MAFYVNAPTSNIPVLKAWQAVHTRFRFLIGLSTFDICDTKLNEVTQTLIYDSDDLIIGTRRDASSYFILLYVPKHIFHSIVS